VSLGSGEPHLQAQPIILKAIQPLKFPPVCVRCGIPTQSALTVKPVEPAKKALDASTSILLTLGPVGHVLLAFIELSIPRVKVPLCGKCKIDRFLLDKRFVGFAILLLVLVGAAIVFGTLHMSKPMAACLPLSLVCLIFLARMPRRHDIETFPVKVYRVNEQYQYAIYGGPLYDHLPRNPAGAEEINPPPLLDHNQPRR
jgi:hypothetical protein